MGRTAYGSLRKSSISHTVPLAGPVAERGRGKRGDALRYYRPPSRVEARTAPSRRGRPFHTATEGGTMLYWVFAFFIISIKEAL